MGIKTAFLGAVAAVALAAGASDAATFDFGGATTIYDIDTGASFSAGGVGVTVYGARKDNFGSIGCLLGGGCYAPEHVSQNADGLGVYGGILDSAELDGQIDEYLIFIFSEAVEIASIYFNNMDSNDPYTLYVGGTDWTWSALPGATSNDNPYVFSPPVVGSVLKIAVDGNASAFRVGKIEISTGPSAVPVPAAGLLLAGGLGAMATLRRKRKAA
ncbi:MAG: VPLPA-CTERM sorting domain-containing protein [Paracoccaceae bacterium]